MGRTRGRGGNDGSFPSRRLKSLTIGVVVVLSLAFDVHSRVRQGGTGGGHAVGVTYGSHCNRANVNPTTFQKTLGRYQAFGAQGTRGGGGQNTGVTRQASEVLFLYQIKVGFVNLVCLFFPSIFPLWVPAMERVKGWKWGE